MSKGKILLNKPIIISIVIPCFNESEGIPHLVSELKNLEERLTDTHELVFVDDGSLDSTYERLTHFYKDRKNKDVNIIRHSKNRGLGAAVQTGISNSKGYYVATVDADCTYELTYMLKMLDIIKKEKADIITASPYHPEGSTFNVPGYRLFLSKNLSNLYNIILRNKFYTYTSMFRIYRTMTIKNVDFKSKGFLSIAEMLIKAHQKGLKVIEYPATLTVRKYGNSDAKILNMIIEHLCFIAKLILKKEDK
jgi:dolichol-phosphate mannosyltransferase